MKQFKVTLLAIMITAATGVFATATPTLDERPTSEEIGALLENPDFLVDKEAVAKILIRVNKDQEIVVLFVETTNPLVEGYVKSRLNYQKAQTLQKGKEYVIPIRFISKK